ncbi:MAG: SAF domain-containing protein [Propioniciclava sp.]|uniref:SAF domain-containing protein n=1 Tax=Propioniciclava sp. TaxID=2038686 RepID=UPI0039E71D72
MATRSAPATIRRVFHLRRRTLAAAFTFLAVLACLLTLRPPQGETASVVTASRPLAAGTVLASADLARVEFPVGTVPEGASSDEAALLGRTLAGPVDQGAPLTAATVGAAERLARPGHLIVPLPLPGDAVGSLLRPGSRLDLLAPDGSTLAADVRVVGPAATDVGPGFTSASRSALVEVPDAVAADIAAHGGSGVTIALR